jgi:O-antigen/teichoic acid export membrane protein
VLFQFVVTTFLLLKNIPNLKLGKEDALGYLNYFYRYCKPLYMYLSISVISVLIGRTILQIINVPEEQSYYALAFKFISVFLIVLGAAVPILTRALSRLDNLIEIKKNTVSSLRLVALFGSVAGLFLYIAADYIVLVFGGQEYSESVRVLRFLVFVPILQISNQVLGSFHYSVGLTARYSRAGIIASFLGIFWVLLAYVLDGKEVFSFDAKVVAITYTLNQLGRFILLYRSFKLSNVQGS